MALFNILAHGFDIDLGSGANIAILMGASVVTSNQFVTTNKRAPREAEKKNLIFGCLLSSFAISISGALILISIFLDIQDLLEIARILPELLGFTWLAILAAITLFHYLVLNLSFGWHANRHATKLQLKSVA